MCLCVWMRERERAAPIRGSRSTAFSIFLLFLFFAAPLLLPREPPTTAVAFPVGITLKTIFDGTFGNLRSLAGGVLTDVCTFCTCMLHARSC